MPLSAIGLYVWLVSLVSESIWKVLGGVVCLRRYVIRRYVCHEKVCHEEECHEEACRQEVCHEEVCHEEACRQEVCNEEVRHEVWTALHHPQCALSLLLIVQNVSSQRFLPLCTRSAIMTLSFWKHKPR